MSGRSTAEIVADLRHVDDHDALAAYQDLFAEAADRLTELAAFYESVMYDDDAEWVKSVADHLRSVTP